MSAKLRNVISWSIFILILIVLFIMIISFVVVMLQPTFFPDKDISGIKNSFNTASSLVGFFSAGIGCYSLWQASKNDKQVEKILQGIDIIKEHQNAIEHQNTPNKNHGFAKAKPDDPNGWAQDTTSSDE